MAQSIQVGGDPATLPARPIIVVDDDRSGLRFAVPRDWTKPDPTSVKTGDSTAAPTVNRLDTWPATWSLEYLERSKILVDVGPHIGTYSCVVAHRVKKVIAIEPSSANRELLISSLIANNLNNVQILPVALGGQSGTATLSTLERFGSDAAIGIVTPSQIEPVEPLVSPFLVNTDAKLDRHLAPSTDMKSESMVRDFDFPTSQNQSVSVVTLDSLDLTNVGFIKINVPSGTLAILEGAASTLANSEWPHILVHLTNADEIEAIKKMTTTQGYRMIKLASSNNLYFISDHFQARQRKTPSVNGRELKDMKQLAKAYILDQEVVDPKATRPSGASASVVKISTKVQLKNKTALARFRRMNWEDYGDLALYFFIEGRFGHAFDCAKHGLSIFQGPTDLLYIFYNVIIGSAFKIRVGVAEARSYLDKVILAVNATKEIRHDCLTEAGDYVEPLKVLRTASLGISTSLGYTSMSPSIIKLDSATHVKPVIKLTKNQLKRQKEASSSSNPSHESSTSRFHNAPYRVIVRTVNYRVENGDYKPNDAKGIARTENKIFEWSGFDHPVTENPVRTLYDDTAKSAYHLGRVRGMENIRLIHGLDEFFCTRMDVTANHAPQTCRGLLESNGAVKETTLLKIGNLTNNEQTDWLPFRQADGLTYFIQSFQPLLIYKIEPDGITESVRHRFNQYHLREFRGSAPPIRFDSGWLMTVHQIYTQKGVRAVFHRWVYLSCDFSEIKFSELFYFEKVGLEGNLGLTHSDEDKLLVTYSVNDASSKVAEVDSQVVRKMLTHARDTC